MTWQQLQQSGRAKSHQTSKKELDELRAVVERDLQDAAVTALSDDRRFATAYNAALQTAKMVISCAGYRVSGLGHHQTSFQAVELAMGSQVATFSAYFESCRRKRNFVDYDMSGIVSGTEVEQLINEATVFLELAEKWIDQNHPAFSK